MYFNKVGPTTKPKGIENVGATCYMNAVLQCFYHVKVLTNELLNYPINMGMPMTIAYKDVISQLSSNSFYPARPIDFKNVISLNPLFSGIQANDSKDLILYFLENIEDELTKQNIFCQNKKYINRIRYLKSSQDQALMNIIQLFQQNHKSIISDLFYGFKSQILTCYNCKKKIINYQIVNLFIFPIEVVYNSKNKNIKNIQSGSSNYNMYETANSDYGNFYNGYKTTYSDYRRSNNGGNNRSSGKKVTLEDCFDNEISDMVFDKDNQIFCNICNKSCNAKGESKIFSTPYILILILNRGKGNEFNCDVEFKADIDIRKYVQNSECPHKYYLIGVISHLGESSMNGHFIADCKHFDGNWYSFSDSSVSGPYSNYNKKGTPYILFYQSEELEK